MNIEVKEMDLFECGRNVLVHCISRDCTMGAGIAKEFNKRFPDMKPKLIDCIRGNHITYPAAIGYDVDEVIVINMITKARYFDKPTYQNFKRSLEKVKEICLVKDFKEIAMPKIGYGLDKLVWSRVENIIRQVFSDTEIDILVCVKED